MRSAPAEEVIARELLPDEQLLWTGQPRQGLIFRPYDLFMVPFSFVWAGGVFLGVGMMFATGAYHHVPLFIIPVLLLFMAVAIYITVGRFYIDAYIRRNTYLALTSDRAIIKYDGLWPKTTAIILRRIENLSLQEGRDGRGTIRFGEPRGLISTLFRYQTDTWTRIPTDCFEGIQDARRVYGLVTNAQREQTNNDAYR